MDDLIWLMEWYESQCNNDWEHQFGVQLTTVDNPGWHLTVHLEDTSLENRPFSRIEKSADGCWWNCWVEEKKFLATCGPRDLASVLAIFRTWAQDR